MRLAELLIMHSDIVQDAVEKVSLRGKKPAEVIRGLRQAYFKSMGTAAALMNDAFLPLPSWFRLENKDDAEAYLELSVNILGIMKTGRGSKAVWVHWMKHGLVMSRYYSNTGSGLQLVASGTYLISWQDLPFT